MKVKNRSKICFGVRELPLSFRLTTKFFLKVGPESQDS